MKLTNAIKKLEKAAGHIEKNRGIYSAKFGNQIVEFMANGRIDENTNICCISTRRVGDEPDSMTDYFPQIWHDNLSQAINFARG